MNKETYDRLWTESWGDQQRFGPVHRRQREELLKLIAQLNINTVLDVGCGNGDNLAAMAYAMPQLVLSGTDISGEALTVASQRVPTANLQQLDVQKQRLDQQFDLIFCNQVVEHLVDDMAAFRNIGLMAKQWVLIATMRGRMRPSERSIGHIRNYSDVELRAKAEAAGLEVIDIFGWGFPFYSPLYRTLIEVLPGEPPRGKFGPAQKTIATLLYHLYALNIPRHGDVVTMLARPLKQQANA